VPAAGLRESLWRTVRCGRWHHSENILVLEARACEKAIQRLACGVFGLNIRQLVLLDNMSLVLSLSRGRSRSFGLLVVMRRIYSYCLARGIRLYVRWIPSELNSSDEPSRATAEKQSSLATRELEHLSFPTVATSSARAGDRTRLHTIYEDGAAEAAPASPPEQRSGTAGSQSQPRSPAPSCGCAVEDPADGESTLGCLSAAAGENPGTELRGRAGRAPGAGMETWGSLPSQSGRRRSFQGP